MTESVGWNATSHQLEVLKCQLQQRLQVLAPQQFDVILDAATTLFVCKRSSSNLNAEINVIWVIDTLNAFSTPNTLGEKFLARIEKRSLPCARQAIADYWLLAPSRAELRTYAQPSDRGYLQCKLHHVGATVSPKILPGIVLEMKEPAPLNFFTRNLNGQHAYAVQAPLLQTCFAET